MRDKFMHIENCMTCNIRLVERGYVRFPCPECGEGIGRCVSCRKQGNPYVCPACGFGGP
ncbi:MAG: Zn-ribbon RNA-binding protein with a function in translation [Candidatus Syntrophoarchaeum caldarius]|uniref:Zn-ribbon RNA-binding protein with a function in translation n=1 Tax=Candidatus Syntropharchaeum caldarium TaxID=1838285 RepID=A0A1F2PCR0_9EURY|nr:MAG: Zn-ribbon RNA-binding protein with a function in translation [Candidatus Syntrophoarchaeum caldarius]